jgi:hypothetical protein
MAHRLILAENTVQVGNVVANTVTATAFSSALPVWQNLDGVSNVVAPGTNAGRLIKLKCHGYISSLVTTPGTLQLTLKWGAVVIGQTALIQLPAAAMVNNHWELDAFILVVEAWSSGRIACQGGGWMDMGLNSGAAAMLPFAFVNTGTVKTGQIVVNTTLAASITLTAQFSIANAANSITLAQMIAEEVS